MQELGLPDNLGFTTYFYTPPKPIEPDELPKVSLTPSAMRGLSKMDKIEKKPNADTAKKGSPAHKGLNWREQESQREIYFPTVSEYMMAMARNSARQMFPMLWLRLTGQKDKQKEPGESFSCYIDRCDIRFPAIIWGHPYAALLDVAFALESRDGGETHLRTNPNNLISKMLLSGKLPVPAPESISGNLEKIKDWMTRGESFKDRFFDQEQDDPPKLELEGEEHELFAKVAADLNEWIWAISDAWDYPIFEDPRSGKRCPGRGRMPIMKQHDDLGRSPWHLESTKTILETKRLPELGEFSCIDNLEEISGFEDADLLLISDATALWHTPDRLRLPLAPDMFTVNGSSTDCEGNRFDILGYRRPKSPGWRAMASFRNLPEEDARRFDSQTKLSSGAVPLATPVEALAELGKRFELRRKMAQSYISDDDNGLAYHIDAVTRSGHLYRTWDVPKGAFLEWAAIECSDGFLDRVLDGEEAEEDFRGSTIDWICSAAHVSAGTDLSFIAEDVYEIDNKHHGKADERPIIKMRTTKIAS